jgi:hypothetical protein
MADKRVQQSLLLRAYFTSNAALKSSSRSNIRDPQSTSNIQIHRTVLDGLGISLEMENEITRVTTKLIRITQVLK